MVIECDHCLNTRFCLGGTVTANMESGRWLQVDVASGVCFLEW